MRILHFSVLFLESTMLCALLGWVVFKCAIPNRPEVIAGETELRFKIEDGQDGVLRCLDSFTVFYATKDNPKQWTDPKLRFTQKIDKSVIGKWYVHKLAEGVKQFRLEFNPKKDSVGERQWPAISPLYLGTRVVREDEIREFFYEPAQKSSYDVILSDYTKGGALWVVIAVAAILDVLILCVMFSVVRKDVDVEITRT